MNDLFITRKAYLILAVEVPNGCQRANSSTASDEHEVSHFFAIAIAFFLYTVIQSYLLHVFYFYTKSHFNWSIYKTALVFGALVGFLWDTLQGGIIEYATFKMPIEVVFVDSAFHTIEGIYCAMILAFFYSKFNKDNLKKID